MSMISKIQRMVQSCRSKWTDLHRVLKKLKYKIDSRKLQEKVKAPGNEVITIASKTTISSKDTNKAESSASFGSWFRNDCHRCTVQLSSLLFDLRTLNGFEARLATKKDKAEIILLRAKTLNITLSKIATENEDYCKRENLLKSVADTLEDFHREFSICIYSIIG